MKISIPDLSLVVLVGASGSGKSTFARTHFRPTEVLSSDVCRGLVSDDENDQSASDAAFEVLHTILTKRLERGLLSVVDATNVQAAPRRTLVEFARKHHVLPVAIVFKMPESLCQERNRARPDRQFGPHVVRNQTRDLRSALGQLRREGFRHIFVLESPEQVADVTLERVPLWNNRRLETGPFDVIGDVHGCYEELCRLLEALGYQVDREGYAAVPPEGRRAVFLGDLVDRGPDSPGVLKLAMAMSEAGHALCVPGNHDMKLVRKLRGADVKLTHGLDRTLEQLAKEPPEFAERVAAFLDGLVSHYVFDGGGLVVAHAGMPEAMQGRGSGRVREFALFGETTGETDEFGLPVRYRWAQDYRGKALVAYGHTPVLEPDWLNNTVCLDTGCVFGGRLSALRYPEREVVSVAAAEVYSEPAKPLGAATERSAQQESDDVLDASDVRGRRHIHTELSGNVVLAEENAAAALEVMARFAANPKWLVYLPPTMSPSETSALPDYLEHPAEALAYFRSEGVLEVVAEEKHMGSRSVVVLCRDEEVAARRFGLQGEGIGAVLTRTGRQFFDDASLGQAMLARLVEAMTRAGLWERLESDWVVLDAELMPWSAKARELIRQQYAPVAAAARATMAAATEAIRKAADRLDDPETRLLADRFDVVRDSAERYRLAYLRYCRPFGGLDDLRLAPFHVMASEGKVWHDRDHVWHMDTLAELCAADPGLLTATGRHLVRPHSAEDEKAVTEAWLSLTESGGEGMVFKPRGFTVRGRKGLIQPAIKCRGREYLRIIYGLDYLVPENLERLRKRNLGRKRGLAVKEFALGIEGLQRFVAREPLRRVHECAFGVLALESEPVDPRL